MKRHAFLFLFLFASLCKLSAQEIYYEKHVAFPEGASTELKVDMASRLVPTAQQLEWQQMELVAFLHFGINTFTGREWGEGTEDPALFNPTDLDCDGWVRTLKESGFKMAILTAKHHDGFCLWPTETSAFSVKSSPWRGGKGDVVRELRDACEKYGLKFGVYLSPWDRNAPCYGDSPAYNRFFLQQLTELLTNYGQVHEVWFDGANGEGPNGKKQEYDWDAVLETIRRLQPKAVTAIMGDDVRWVGNERGLGRATEWSATALTPGSYARSEAVNQALGIAPTGQDLGSREVLARANELFWYPSEVDVSIRPGWFFHEDQNEQVKSLRHLVDIYFESVGYNSVLLLNIPPDTRGHIHENDTQRLRELAAYLQETFAHNYLTDSEEPWTAKPGDAKVYRVKQGALVNTFMLQEDITKGQRMEDFLLEGLIDGQWKVLAEGTTVGYKRLVRFHACRPEQIRLTVRASRGEAHLINAGLFYAKPLTDEAKDAEPVLGNLPNDGWKVMGDEAATQAIDGNRKTVWRTADLTPLRIDLGREVKVKGFCYAPAADGNLQGTIYKYEFYVSKNGKKWKRCEVDGEFSNIMHNPVPFFVQLKKSCEARYVMLKPLAEINGEKHTSVAEIGITVE